MMYGLPESLTVCGLEYPIRSDFRAILDIMTALNDPELTETEKSVVSLAVFYPDFNTMDPRHYQEAIRQCFWFINGGTEDHPEKKGPKLVDWEQDFPHIIAPINRVAGCEIRSVPKLHWWTFLSYYMEIGGDCTFAQIVRIRDMKARGKKLEKFDREWYQQNRHLVDLRTNYTDAENALLKMWGGE